MAHSTGINIPESLCERMDDSRQGEFRSDWLFESARFRLYFEQVAEENGVSLGRDWTQRVRESPANYEAVEAFFDAVGEGGLAVQTTGEGDDE